MEWTSGPLNLANH